MTALAWALAATIVAQAAAHNPYLDRALEQLRALDEQAALTTLEQARAWRGNSLAELARIHLYAGLAHAGLTDGPRAVASFRDALLLDPTLELPAQTSPRVREWWAQAKVAAGIAPKQPAPGLQQQLPAPAPTPVAAAPTAAVGRPPPEVSREGGLPRWTVPVVLAGSAVAAGVVGGVFGARARTDALNANSQQEVGAATALRSRAESEALTANLLFGGAVVLAGGASVVWWVKF